VESDVRYYRRRACEELAAATRSVTDAARERRMQLVALYVERLRELNEPSPFSDRELASGGAAFQWANDRETVASL
jgi:hypothetical protein